MSLQRWSTIQLLLIPAYYHKSGMSQILSTYILSGSHRHFIVGYVEIVRHYGEALIVLILGFEATVANLLSVPVYAWACLVTTSIGFIGDRLGRRGYINL